MSKTELMLAPDISLLIHFVRTRRVILDADLARVYGVPTKALNQAVKRNISRFPADFMFRLNLAEGENLMRSQFVTASPDTPAADASKRNIRHLPYAFTEHGALMAANILNQRRRRPLPCPEEELNVRCAWTWNDVVSARAESPRHFQPQQLVQAKPQWAITRGNPHRKCR